jgi:hypothetical protein
VCWSHILISTRRAGLPSNRRIVLYSSSGTRQRLHPLRAGAPSRTTRNAWLRGWCTRILRAEMTRAMFNRSLTSLSKLMDSLKSDVEEVVDPLPCVHLEKPPQLEKVSLPTIPTTAFATQCLLLRSWLRPGGTPAAESHSLTSKYFASRFCHSPWIYFIL